MVDGRVVGFLLLDVVFNKKSFRRRVGLISDFFKVSWLSLVRMSLGVLLVVRPVFEQGAEIPHFTKFFGI